MDQPGELDNFQPFGNFAKGLFSFLNYFSKKEGFLNRLIVYDK